MNSPLSFVQPDVTLKLDLSGVIREVDLAESISSEGIDSWLGRPWADTVTGSGNTQVRQMLLDATRAGVSGFHQVGQRFPSGMELAVEYTTVRLGGDSGLIAIGRSLDAVADLRSRLITAQKSLERDYWKLRDIETRYRLLFDASTQPLLLIDSDNTCIREANPAAIRALGVVSDHELLPEILPAEREAFRSMLARVRENGKAPGIVLHLGPDRMAWMVRASLIAAEPVSVFVLQLAPGVTPPARVEQPADPSVHTLIERLPDGYVVLDGEGRILRATSGFLKQIAQGGEPAQVGDLIGKFLGQPPQRIHAQSALGHKTLREIVKDTIAEVERQCIEEALEEAQGNRTTAAEMLGLSRQSLYVKLRQYALEEDAAPPALPSKSRTPEGG